MKLQHLSERSHYDKKHKCLTPAAQYSTHIGGREVSIKVTLPFDLELTKDKSEKLEADLHYAVEELISPLFKGRP